jgi:hypothetical protein
MTNRILLNSSGLKISKSGVNVLTAGNADLLFTSDYSHLAFYATGTFTIAAGDSHLTVPYDRVTFGKTFASPPYCMFFYRNGSDRYLVGAGGCFLEISPGGGGTARRRVLTKVTTTKIQTYVFNAAGTGTLPAVTLEYHVMDFGWPA